MSQSQRSSPSSSNSHFQLIFDNALKVYEKRTKKNLLKHPLASQLQACNSSDEILTILQQQVHALNQFQSRDDRWDKWLGPTVNVLHTLSETLGEGVSLVRDMSLSEICTHTCGRNFHLRKPYLQELVLYSPCVSFLITLARPV